MRKVISYCKRKVKILISKYFEKYILKIEELKIHSIFNKNQRIIIIYSIGKVGSSSIYNSLKKSKVTNIPVFHVHALNELRLEEQKEYYRNSKRGSVPFHLIQSTAISKELKFYKGQIFVINLLREPIAREMSSVFQDSFNFSNSIKANDEQLRRAIRLKFDAMLINLPENEWFERELKSVFEIDILKKGINVNKGYYVDSINQVKFGLVRVEDLSNVYPVFMQKMFGADFNIPLVVANEAKDKFYNEGYKKLVNELNVTEEEFNIIAGSTFFKKFYSDLFLKVKEKWVRN